MKATDIDSVEGLLEELPDFDQKSEEEPKEVTADGDAEVGEAPAGEGEASGEEASLTVSVGEDEQLTDAESSAPSWVRELRKNYRELQKKNRELEAKIHQPEAGHKEILLPKPTLEGCDYDDKLYEDKLEAWYASKRERDMQEMEAQARASKEKEEWERKLAAYSEAKEKLGARDYEVAESVVEDALSSAQQAVILQGSTNPALLIYAIGKNPTRAKALAQQSDLVKFAFEIAKLEAQLKVAKKSSAPPPEKSVKGSASVSGTVDSNLERLRAEAVKTGDLTKVIAYQKMRRDKKAG